MFVLTGFGSFRGEGQPGFAASAVVDPEGKTDFGAGGEDHFWEEYLVENGVVDATLKHTVPRIPLTSPTVTFVSSL
jgi:hypothetical protein